MSTILRVIALVTVVLAAAAFVGLIFLAVTGLGELFSGTVSVVFYVTVCVALIFAGLFVMREEVR
jgi:hypothetical protein